MSNRTDRDELLSIVRALERKLDRPPSRQDVSKYSDVQPGAHMDEFGSWEQVLEAADLDQMEANTVERERLLEELQRIADEIGETPTQDAVRDDGEYPLAAYQDEFDSFVLALEEADLEPSSTQYRFSDVETPEDKRATENVRFLSENGPTVIDKLPTETNISDKQHGLWKLSVKVDRGRSDRPDVPQSDTVCYLDDEHDPETVIRAFFAANSRLLEGISERVLVDRIRSHRREWQSVAEAVIPELRDERGLAKAGSGETNGLLVVDCSGDDIWQSCAHRTVTNRVSVAEYRSDVDGDRYVWGFSEEYEPLWAQVDTGDTVVFALEADRYTQAVHITDCVQDWRIGSKLWAEYEDGIRVSGPDEPWRYVLLGQDGVDIDIPADQLWTVLEATASTDPVQYVDSDACGKLGDSGPWAYMAEIETESKPATRVPETDDAGTEQQTTITDGSPDGTRSTTHEEQADRDDEQHSITVDEPTPEQGGSATADTYAIDVRLAAIATDRDGSLSETTTRAVRHHLKRAIDGDHKPIISPSEPTVPVELTLKNHQQQFLDLLCENNPHCESPHEFVNDALHTLLDAPDPEEQTELNLTIDATTAVALQTTFDEGTELSDPVESALLDQLSNDVSLQDG